MTQELIFSVSGMQGIIGEDFAPPTAAECSCAFDSLLRGTNETGDGCTRVYIGRCSMHKDEFTAGASQAGRIIETAKERFAHATLNTSDGCRFDFDDAWGHLRTSNAEPVTRVIVEVGDGPSAPRCIQAVSDIRATVLEQTGGQ